MIAWYGMIAATGWHPDEPALPILLVLGVGAIVIGALWAIAFATLFHRSR